MTRFSTTLLVTLGASFAALPALSTEMPTKAQKDAIRSECRSDFIKYCMGVKPDGLPALECLEENMDSLSDDCQAAVLPVEQETGTGG